MSWQKLLMTTFGLGLLKPAPGTWGSTFPVAIAVLLLWWLGPGVALDAIIVAVGVIFSVICIALGDWAEREFAGKDPGQVVADEVAGQCIALLVLPWRTLDDPGAWKWNILLALGAFLAFRLFDIAKPPPINRLQAIPGGWGILVDDLVAGVYALIVVQVVARIVL